jgi:hypothetical protein
MWFNSRLVKKREDGVTQINDLASRQVITTKLAPQAGCTICGNLCNLWMMKNKIDRMP